MTDISFLTTKQTQLKTNVSYFSHNSIDEVSTVDSIGNTFEDKLEHCLQAEYESCFKEIYENSLRRNMKNVPRYPNVKYGNCSRRNVKTL